MSYDINPYYIAYMQGGDYIINAKIDDLPAHVENNIQQPGQYFIKIWIQYKSTEWEVDYNKGWVGCLSSDESYLINKTFKKGDKGPIKIAKITGQVAKFGIVAFLSIMAYISISLGFINLFPIPMLDGGHLMFYAFEKILGRPLTQKTQEGFFRIGLFLLLSLMFFTTFNDLKDLGLF